MRFITRLPVALGIVIAAAALVFAGVDALKSSKAEATAPFYGAAPKSTFRARQAKAFNDFPVYNVGESFRGLPLVAILRRHDTGNFAGEAIRSNDVSFIYGDCLPHGDSGCAAPLEVKVSPSCLYTVDDIDVPSEARTSARGVPAWVYEGGMKLILVAGRSTISIYSTSKDMLIAAANSLRGVNNGLAVGEALPAPPKQAYHGTCR